MPVGKQLLLLKVNYQLGESTNGDKLLNNLHILGGTELVVGRNDMGIGKTWEGDLK